MNILRNTCLGPERDSTWQFIVHRLVHRVVVRTPAAHGPEELFPAVLGRKVPSAHSRSACVVQELGW
jgi:hypothetical protein